MRMLWVSQYGNLKIRALYKVISEFLDLQDETDGTLKYSKRLKEDALLYRQLRDGDTDDPELEEYWLSLDFLNLAQDILL